MGELIRMDGKYQTRDGRAVRVLAVDAQIANGKLPVVALVHTANRNDEYLYCTHADGIAVVNSTSAADLIPAPEEFEFRRWVNIYRQAGGTLLYMGDTLYTSKEEAARWIHSDCIVACVEVLIAGEVKK